MTEIIGNCTTSDLSMENPYVMEKVFGYLEVKDVKSCRFINKCWNQEALRYLSTQGLTRINVKFENCKRLKGLLHLLKSCTTPQWFLYNMDIDLCVTYLYWFSENLQEFFEVFGKHCKVLYLRSPPEAFIGHFETLILYKIVTSWCTNLLKLQIMPNESSPKSEIDDEGFKFDKCKIKSPLKLQTLAIGERPELPISIRNWMVSFINSCPDLKSLKMNGDRRGWYASYFTGLDAYPNIGPQLETFETRCWDEKLLFQFISEMSNLKKITLQRPFHYPRRGNIVHEIPKQINFSCMKYSLKTLILDDIWYSESKDEYGVICIAAEFPNLDYFSIWAREVGIEAWDLKPNPKLKLMKKNPHGNLKKLLLLDDYTEISDEDGLQDLVNAFPNLEFLHLSFQIKGWTWCDDRVKLQTVLTTLSTLSNLKELYIEIYLGRNTELIEGVNFQWPQSFPELRRLGIELLNRKGKKYSNTNEKSIPNEWLPSWRSFRDICFTKNSLTNPMLVAQQLEELRLVEFDKFCSPKEIRKCMDFAMENDIPLEFYTRAEIRAERPTWYYYNVINDT